MPSAASLAWHRQPIVWLTLATLACLAPFATKAVHIDDYLFLRAARQIVAHPFDPFGTTVNWYGFEMPLADVTQNPPLACYYLAGAGSLFGWSEIALHLAFLLPAVAAVLGTYVLARRLGPHPGWVALLTLVTPAFWVSATTLMCDVPLLALWVWATEFWMRGLERERHRWFAAAAGLVALASLTKYFGAALVPLLLAYTLARHRRPRWCLLWLALPCVALFAYEWLTAQRYGHGMLSGAGLYARLQVREGGVWQRALIALSFLGGCLLPAIFFAPWLRSWRTWAGAAVVIAGLTALLGGVEQIGVYPVRGDGAPNWFTLAQLAAFSVIGLTLLLTTLHSVGIDRSPDSLLLALWILGTLFFCSVLNWTINARSLLPLVPAVAILIARRWAATPVPRGRAWYRLGLFLPGLLLGAVVAQADAAFAANSRTVARILHERLAGGSAALWFQGHWGFQYYMEQAGARPLDQREPRLAPGDYLVAPVVNTNVAAVPLEVFAPAGDIEIRARSWATTMHIPTGAGFYADAFGPLPFVLGPPPAEMFYLSRLRQPSWGR